MKWRRSITLRSARPGTAPTVLYRHADGSSAVAILSEIPGEQLSGRNLDDGQLAALRSAVVAVHGSTGRGSARFRDVVSPPLHMFARVDAGMEALPDLRAVPDVWAECRDRLRRALQARAQEAVVFGRGDPNLENCLWDGARVRFVDFEYSGLSSRSFELANLVGHVNSRGTPLGRWLAFVDSFGLSDAEWSNFDSYRVLIEAFWLWHACRGSLDGATHVSLKRLTAALETF